MSYTLGEAAKATGMSRAAIMRAINNGTLAAGKRTTVAATLSEGQQGISGYVEGPWCPLRAPSPLQRPPIIGERSARGHGLAFHPRKLEHFHPDWKRPRSPGHCEERSDEAISHVASGGSPGWRLLRRFAPCNDSDSVTIPVRVEIL